MNKSFLGNDYAFQCLKHHINQTNPGPLILLGSSGLGKTLAAKDAACELFHCSYLELDKNPDYYYLDKNHESLKVEDALSIIEKSSLSAISERKLFIIRNIESMNAQAQNKILKLLEDRNKNNFIIMTCNQDILLPTIKSRCNTILFHPLSDSEMESYFLKQHISFEDISFFTFLCGSCPYIFTNDATDFFTEFKNTFKEICALKKKEDIYNLLHLIKEKDVNNFYDCHADHYDIALQMLQYIFYHLTLIKSNVAVLSQIQKDFSNIEASFSLSQAFHASCLIENHRKQWKTSSYTKNDFFDLIRGIIKDW